MLRIKNSLVWKLTIWFFLLAMFPIVVMTIFVRQNIQEEMSGLALTAVASQSLALAGELATAGPAAVPARLSEASGEGRVAFLLGPDGHYLAHPDPALVGQAAYGDLPPDLAGALAEGRAGATLDQAEGRIIGFAPLAPGGPLAVLSVDLALVIQPMQRIERSALVQILVSLIIVCVAGGAAIWVMFNPIQNLTQAAVEVGNGNLAVQVDTSDMEGELEVLTDSFNQMTRQLRDAYDDLEQRVEERTEELRQSRETERQLARENALLAEIGRIISSTLEVDEVYDRFAAEMKKLVDFDRMAINILNPDGATFLFKYATGPLRPGRVAPEVRSLPGTQTERVLTTGQTLIINDASRDDQFTSTADYLDMGLRSSIMVPLFAKGRVIGAMSLRSRRVGAYEARHRSILERLANQIAPAIQNAELYAQTRAAEEALRESEERYRTLFEQSTDAIFVASDGKVVEANRAAAEMFGYTTEQVIGLDVEQVYVNPEDRAQFRQELFQQGSVRDFELKMRQSSGAELDCLLTAAIQRSGDGRDLGIQGVIRDITERKQAELLNLQQTRELAVLEERNRMAREIHDTLAQGFTGIVLQMEAAEQAVEDRPEEVVTHLSQAKALARASLQEARRTVWDLLPQALEQLPLDAALAAEVRKFGDTAGWQQAGFELSGQSRDLPTPVQAGLLRICQESLNNAMKHADASRVQVKLAYETGGVCLSVQDNGQGFDTSQPMPVTQQGGLGLNGMEQRARLMGAQLSVHSEAGGGTLVEVRVPAGPEMAR